MEQKGVIFMDKFEKIAKELKSMDKSRKTALVNEIKKDPEIMKQVSAFLENPDVAKKLKDLLG